ncbi:nucleoside-diphosphate-sugar epimerase [Microbacterium phyllosphaerae]|uniref:Nucleoside-diphosphate-sugar epimerase n=1 Tax=Microbacterium phyllosphaerae TaxID=124798 RepID=A0ABS4WL99_9MICO|nr:NAD-dependent epimerase/dehydratase family protein [Microbacterium phyllosphaerae]MBP2376982.1 nucleoside-diphosphate-sugar epimerase [Microbacterium phyllosphaerae]
MKVFITGAGGFIGGSVARVLIDSGHTIRGLTRSEAGAEKLAEQGIEPLIGSLDDAKILADECRSADAVISAADADHADSVTTMLRALEGSGKSFVHTSGSSVVGDDARGERATDSLFDEDTPFIVQPRKAARHAIDNAVLAASEGDVRSAVICPSLVYGTGRGSNPGSIQVPFLVEQAMKAGVVRVVGTGRNRWSTVHIDDLADLYRRVLLDAPAGAFYFAENGESSFAEIGAAIADRLGLGEVESWDADDAAEKWGPARAYFTYGSNSRVRAKRARRELRWAPDHGSVLEWIHDSTSLEGR